MTTCPCPSPCERCLLAITVRALLTLENNGVGPPFSREEREELEAFVAFAKERRQAETKAQMH